MFACIVIVYLSSLQVGVKCNTVKKTGASCLTFHLLYPCSLREP